MWLFNYPKFYGSLYYTSRLSHHITENINPENNRLEYIKLPFDNSSISEQIELIQNNLNEKKDIQDTLITIKEKLNERVSEPKIQPYDYQLDASEKLIKYFEENNKGILSLPCGCGKTFTSYLIAKNYNYIILISPLKQFAKQNLNKYIEYGFNKNDTLLVDSDGTRDINLINEFILKDKWLISCTYKSVDMLEFVYERDDILIIIDEFHNLSKNNVYNKLDPFYRILDTNNKILSLSATPRIYELENEFLKDESESLDSDNDNEFSEDDDYYSDSEYSFNNYIDLGEIIYSMNFTTAIKQKFITDYRIYLPSIHETNDELIQDINNEINLDIIDNETRAKCIFLYKCLVEKGAKKCIIYCQDTNKLQSMINMILELNSYYYLDFDIKSITSSTSYKKREKILNDFENNSKIQLLFSIRILDECIDIPTCDSIYITYETSCKIRTI